MTWRVLRFAAGAVLASSLSGATFAAAVEHTTFLHHFDGPIEDPAVSPGAADFAAGTAAVQVAGGKIDSAQAKFGSASLLRGGTLAGNSVGGRLRYKLDDGNFPDPTTITSAGTIEMWIRPTATSFNIGTFVGFFGSWSALSGQDIRFYRNTSGTLGAYMQSANTSVGGGAGSIWSITTTGAFQPSANEWHHLAWTWDFGSQTSSLYLDGNVLPANISKTNPATLHYIGPYSSDTFSIGEVQNGSGTFQGWMDEFRISDIDRYGNQNFTPPTSAFVVPEPASLGLAGVGLLALRRRK